MKQIKRAYILNLIILGLEVFSVAWMFSGLRLPGTGSALSASRITSLKYVTFLLSFCLYKLNHIKYSFNDIIDNEADLLALLKSQQGEIDAVLMYQSIAAKISDEEVKKLILVIGNRKAFEIIARQEYAAEKKYDEIVAKFPSVLSVQQDEHLHGDRMLEISKKV